MNKSFSFIDICAGIGGFRLPLEKLGGNCIYSSDINFDSEKTYKANHGEGYNNHDLFEIEEKEFPYADVLCAGFPCQPFSIAGKRRGFEDARGTVIFKLTSLIRSSKPKIVFLENVTNLIRIQGGKIFKRIARELEEVGYSVHYDVLDSADFGVPQARKRVYIVAVRDDIQSFGFSITKKRTKRYPFRDFINEGDNSIPISNKWNTYIDLYTGLIEKEEVDFVLPKTRKSLERIDNGADLDDCVFQIRSSGIRAISLDKPFPTFAVSISGGGAMIPVYSKERRHISLIEIKRLMGFPDDFIFPVSRTHAIKQLANAVCPPVIESIARDFLRLLNDQTLLVEEPSVCEYV